MCSAGGEGGETDRICESRLLFWGSWDVFGVLGVIVSSFQNSP